MYTTYYGVSLKNRRKLDVFRAEVGRKYRNPGWHWQVIQSVDITNKELRIR